MSEISRLSLKVTIRQPLPFQYKMRRHFDISGKNSVRVDLGSTISRLDVDVSRWEGQTVFHCKIKENVLIQDLKPSQ